MATRWTRAAGRQMLSRIMHGADSLTGAAAATFATDTFSIASLAPYPDDYFNDWHGRVYSGPLMGANFSVEDFESDFGPTFIKAFFTVKPAQPKAFAASDMIELHQDYSPQEMDDAINLAISFVENEALQDCHDDTVQLIESSYEYDIPPALAYIDDLFQFNDDGTIGQTKGRLDPRWWSILPGSPPKIWFNRDMFGPTGGRKLRIIGQKSPAQLTKDDDICEVSQAYVLLQAKANLHLARSEEPGDEHGKALLRAQGLASQERSRLLVAGRGAKVAF